MKRLLTVFLALGLLFSSLASPVMSVKAASTGVDAEKPETPETRWTNTTSIIMVMAFTGNTADCEIQLNAVQGTTYISATIRLYRNNMDGSYTLLKTFPTANSNWQSLFFSDYCIDYRICPINVYMLTIDAEVTSNGVTEDVYEELVRAYQ